MFGMVYGSSKTDLIPFCSSHINSWINSWAHYNRPRSMDVGMCVHVAEVDSKPRAGYCACETSSGNPSYPF